MDYQHTQVGYLMFVVTLIVFVFFTWVHILAFNEPQSVDSGTNFAITSLMILILFVLFSLWSLQVTIDKHYLRIKFGWGIYKKKFLLKEIQSVKAVKNHWYYGWGIRLIFWPKTIIYNISGYGAVELITKNGKRYRIGTDEPIKLEQALRKSIKK